MIDDRVELLQETLRYRNHIVDMADGLYEVIDPFRDDNPDFVMYLLEVLEDTMPKLEDWPYEIISELQELGRW